ncbi:Superfamily I DNA and RNA helicase-like protein [Rubellimicrobium mesophilum DSM 19309]|uniref:DNA 3'-5' helicase n=1 Tax=Rubellimicrobium mesophilum DSM 19309 TaxID=442562 RepID=A0A017HLW2_9RHOB|nr:UvrD-helicase domain-containing protein [Rubellimicrobium mesophilum]EYD75315.1 Superfamily I DNA and RNA helicase-like protein [Rubellimicrobium mesophilum DSM 19309]
MPGVGEDLPHGQGYAANGVDRPLVDLLPSELSDLLFEGMSRSAMRLFEALDGRAGTGDILAVTQNLEDRERADLLERVFNQLAVGNVDGAGDIIRYATGQMEDLPSVPDDQLLEVEDGPDVRWLRIGSPEYEAWMKAFELRSKWQEWFLFLHRDQERVVKADYPGPAHLSGVSGSGKTCVAVRRALRLAETPGSKVLLVTLNRSLAGLLNQLVEAIAIDPEVRSRIEVSSFFQLAQKLLHKLEPANALMYDDVTWKLEEHVDEVFREFYRCWLNSDAAAVLMPLHISLNARGISAEVYLREEFDWIRSAFLLERRSEYRRIERQGRRVPITSDRREAILQGLAGWEAKMKAVGVIDYLGLTAALAQHQGDLKPSYTNILIDEAQDFGTTELAILRTLVPRGDDDLFLCGDVAQTVLPKHRSLAEAQIQGGTRAKIVQNYRNSREILSAAYAVLQQNLTEDMFDSEDLEILDPKYASFRGSAPMALSADSLSEEIPFALAYAKSSLKQGARSVCIAFAGFSARDVAAFARRCGIQALDGAYEPSQAPLVFSDLEQTKGYEFDCMIIVNCAAGVLPPRDGPEEEAYRIACKLYVAMTRARRELIVSFSGTASPWIVGAKDSFGTAFWSAVEEPDPEHRAGVPEILPEIQPEGGVESLYALTGRAFLYTSLGLGLSVETQQKLLEIVDGQGSLRGKVRLKWRTVGALLNDLHQSRRSDVIVGPVVAAELRSKLPLNLEVRAGELA